MPDSLYIPLNETRRFDTMLSLRKWPSGASTPWAVGNVDENVTMIKSTRAKSARQLHTRKQSAALTQGPGCFFAPKEIAMSEMAVGGYLAGGWAVVYWSAGKWCLWPMLPLPTRAQARQFIAENKKLADAGCRSIASCPQRAVRVGDGRWRVDATLDIDSSIPPRRTPTENE